MVAATSSASGQPYRALYHPEDTRYNLCEPPSSLEHNSRIKIEQQARSVACLVKKKRLIERRSNDSVQYFFQSSLTLADFFKSKYLKQYKNDCESNGKPYDDTKPPPSFEGHFANELCLGQGAGTAFLIGKQLVLTAAHCICDSETGTLSKIKLASLLVIFGFQMQSPDQVCQVFDQKDVYHIEEVWAHVYTKGVADWAIVKLDREVEDRDFLTFGDSSLIPLKTKLYMLGHPLGLPLKLTIGAEVKGRPKPKRIEEIKKGDEPDEPPLFDADLDAFPGNSGSPIFELEKKTIIAMLFAGNTARFKIDKKTMYFDQISTQIINKYGYEKCLKIASIDFLKTVLSSSFRIGHTHFSGRMVHLAKLKAHLIPPSSCTKVHILYGPGGVGKSELANTFAKQSVADFSFVWSISCGNDEEQSVGYQGLAKRLKMDVKEKETLHSLINRVHRKLEEHNESKPWLLLFDNLQNSPDFSPYPALPVKGGSILITSYKSHIIHTLPGEVILATEVRPLEFEEALKFLEDMTEKSLDACKKLLTHVGCYPLLLGQVANYIKKTKIEVEEYLGNLDKHPSEKTLEAVFSMTLQQLSPSAKKWLFLCSQLNAALIPVSYLKAWLDIERIPEEQRAIIEDLKEHALLSYNPQEEIFSLHLEFQRILRTLDMGDTRQQVAHLLIKIAEKEEDLDIKNKNWTMAKTIIWASHAMSVLEATGQKPLEDLVKAALLYWLGKCASIKTHCKEPLRYLNESLKIRRTLLAWNHPDIARSLNIIGNCYLASGNVDVIEALKAHNEALEIRRSVFGENHADVALSLNNIGLCYRIQGKIKEALKKQEEALKIRRLVLEENHPDVALSFNNIGACYEFEENYVEALKLHNEALKIRRIALGNHHPFTGMSLSNIGSCLFSQKNYTEALKSHVEALEIYRVAHGNNHLIVAKTLTAIGNCYKSQGNIKKALENFNEALTIYKAVSEDPLDIASCSDDVGSCHYSQENYTEALKMFQDALVIKKPILGKKHLDVALSLNEIGACYLSLGDCPKALKKHLKALEIRRSILGDRHPQVAKSLYNIARCYESQEKYSDSLKVYYQALEIWRATLNENNPDIANSLYRIGSCCFFLENYTEALRMHSKALQMRQSIFGNNHTDVAMSFINVGRCYQAQKNYNQALIMHSEAHRIYITSEANPFDVAISLNNMGTSLFSQGNHTMALKANLDALKNLRAAFGNNHPLVRTSLNNIGMCYVSLEHYEEGRRAFSEALEVSKAIFGEIHPEIGTSLDNVGMCYEFQDKSRMALKMFKEALKIRRAIFKEPHPEIDKSLQKIRLCEMNGGCNVS